MGGVDGGGGFGEGRVGEGGSMKTWALQISGVLIDLLMGLIRGAVFHHCGVPGNCPLALMGRFPSLMGSSPTLMGRFPY